MKVEQSLLALDRYISRRWRELPLSEQCTMTYTEFDYLETLYELKSARLSDLAKIMCVSKPTASNMVSRLEKKGMVSRSACPDDGRAIAISLSDKGHAFLDRDREIFGGFIREVFQCLSPEEQSKLEYLMAEMVSKAIKK